MMLVSYILSIPAAAGWRTSPLTACSPLLTAIRTERETEPINIYCLNGDILADANRLYTENGVKRMLEKGFN